MFDFKYQIGDILIHRAALAECVAAAAAGQYRWPAALLVVERNGQQCPGGVQLHYTFSGEAGPRRLNEIELAPYSEFDAAGLAEAAARAKGRLDKIRLGLGGD